MEISIITEIMSIKLNVMNLYRLFLWIVHISNWYKRFW